MSKLHGSLNWSLGRDGILNVYCDMRAAFRGGGTAAIVPPLPEKHVPEYLRPVWDQAFDTLSRADVWIVIGYSLPKYDLMVRDLFRAAHHRQPIEIQDPNAESVAESFSEVAPGASFELEGGLPRADPTSFPGGRTHRRRKLGGDLTPWMEEDPRRLILG
jgi:hypothetical protein